MKNKLIIAMLLITVSCAKKNVTPYDGVYNITETGVLYDKSGVVKYENGTEYQKTSSSWYKVGTYSFDDSIFSHTSTAGYTYKALYFVSGNTLTFRDVRYRFNYPSGGEPKDVLKKQ